MTPEDKKELKRLYDIEYRKNNRIKLLKAKKDKYDALTSIEKSNLHKQRYLKLDKTKKKKEDKEYAIKNKTKLNQNKKKWADDNPLKNKQAKYNYVARKLKSDPLYKFKHNLGCAIRQALKKNGFSKNTRTFTIIGCSFDEFKKHIESKFESWMNWGNYGDPKDGVLVENKTWDIDHIIPLSTAKTEEDVIKLNHYTNLQPLCSYFNRHIKKNNYSITDSNVSLNEFSS